MLYTDLMIFKTQQEELHRRAARYHLLKSLENSPQILDRIYSVIGNTMISLGQGLIKRAQAAQNANSYIQINQRGTLQL